MFTRSLMKSLSIPVSSSNLSKIGKLDEASTEYPSPFSTKTIVVHSLETGEGHVHRGVNSLLRVHTTNSGYPIVE
ncbi:hypothetical protein D3C80_1831300 [compost metagenome]